MLRLFRSYKYVIIRTMYRGSSVTCGFLEKTVYRQMFGVYSVVFTRIRKGYGS
jgi:hypothetical protein